jgi:hypothetical protein
LNPWACRPQIAIAHRYANFVKILAQWDSILSRNPKQIANLGNGRSACVSESAVEPSSEFLELPRQIVNSSRNPDQLQVVGCNSQQQ